MSAIAFEYPSEISALRDGIVSFIRAEVISRHEKNAELFADPRKIYDDKGAYVPRVLELIREVRMASAKAGYYAMSAPENIGGGGLGYLAYFVAWEQIFRMCGTHYWLGHFMISHWAKGPSPVLEKVTPKMRELALPKLLSGEHSMCFAMSEPGAGSDAARVSAAAATADGGWLGGGRHGVWLAGWARRENGPVGGRGGPACLSAAGARRTPPTLPALAHPFCPHRSMA